MAGKNVSGISCSDFLFSYYNCDQTIVFFRRWCVGVLNYTQISQDSFGEKEIMAGPARACMLPLVHRLLDLEKNFLNFPPFFFFDWGL